MIHPGPRWEEGGTGGGEGRGKGRQAKELSARGSIRAGVQKGPAGRPPASGGLVHTYMLRRQLRCAVAELAQQGKACEEEHNKNAKRTRSLLCKARTDGA